jgi:hypothetical protein
MISFELIIFKNFFENKEYTSKVLPYLKSSYFTVQRQDQKIVFNLIKNYVKQYKRMPTYSGIKTMLQKHDKISETIFTDSVKLIEQVEQMKLDDWDFQWLIDETEEFCRMAALEIEIVNGMDRIDNKEKLSDIPDRMKKALSIDFNVTLGLDYFSEEEIDNRWTRYHEKKYKFPCKIEGIQQITNGGIERKTLNILMGFLGTGKTSSLVSLACDYIENGFNVIYFSFEMDDYKICHRVDARFLQTAINEIEFLDENHYKETLRNLGYENKLIVKEMPEGEADINDIKIMLDDLKLKKNFIPDIIFIDYINIMGSTKHTRRDGTYQYVKSVTEEVRAFAKMNNYGVWSATQSNKDSDGKNDVGLSNQSESVGLPQTVDLHIAIIEPSDLQKRGLQIWKNLKDRYSGLKDKKFVVKPNFDIAMTRDFKGDTGDILDELEEVRNSKRSEKIENMRNLFENEEKTNEIKEGFQELLNE